MRVKVLGILLALLILCTAIQGLALVGSVDVVDKNVDIEALKVVYNSNLDKSVLIVLHGGEYGTGWWLSPGIIITAAHVVGYDPQAQVELVKGDWRAFGHVIFLDKERDIAVIETDTEPPDTVYLKICDKVEKGQEIIAIGYPMEVLQLTGSVEEASVSPRAAFGEISWIDPTKPWLAEIHVTVDAGNSGGPVVDADHLCVVGLVTFALPGKVANMYYITNVKALLPALQQAGIEPQIVHIDYYQQAYSPSDLQQPPSTNKKQLLIMAGIAATISAITTFAIVLSIRGGRR